MNTPETPAAPRNTEEQLVLRDLLTAIRQCEQERQTAQLSGLETGWEHPATQTMWRRILFMADRVTQNAEVGGGRSTSAGLTGSQSESGGN